MKTSEEVTADKLRGGFYSPPALVKICLDRAASLIKDGDSLRVLEPSAGDGAFLAGLSQHQLGARVAWTTAVEVIEAEAAACGKRLADAQFDGDVIHGSILKWALENDSPYDLALGNPPFVRFQFVDDAERISALAVGDKHGAEFKGVSNLWLPVLVSAIGALRPGGAFAFIVPAESFTGISGYQVREWLLGRVRDLHVDLFPPASFPNVLQEVVVLSGEVTDHPSRATRNIRFREHSAIGVREWEHKSVGEARTWTRYLLTPGQVASLEEAVELTTVSRLGDIARFEVATVTGANTFFCVDYEVVREFRLEDWTRPMLPRTRYALGLAFTSEDHQSVCRDGLAGHMLDFAADRPDPMQQVGPSTYLASGKGQEFHKRFKCRIREPWYRVPIVIPGAMMMAKRSHQYPRVIVNDASVLTTDTIYRGRLLPGATTTPKAFAATFHNSLTLLTSEIEGRSFGGGVLELVPSEISRLALPIPFGMEDEFDHLDTTCRRSGAETSDALIEETDRLILQKTDGLNANLMQQLQEARQVLVGLRISRN